MYTTWDAQHGGSRKADSDREDSDEYSCDDPDTLFERECGSTPGASPRSAASGAPGGGSAGPGREAGTPRSGGGGGGGGAGYGATNDGGVGRAGRRPVRCSSEKFDAVMDTLAAQVR